MSNDLPSRWRGGGCHRGKPLLNVSVPFFGECKDRWILQIHQELIFDLLEHCFFCSICIVAWNLKDNKCHSMYETFAVCMNIYNIGRINSWTVQIIKFLLIKHSELYIAIKALPYVFSSVACLWKNCSKFRELMLLWTYKTLKKWIQMRTKLTKE